MRRSPRCPTTHGCTRESDACESPWRPGSYMTSVKSQRTWILWFNKNRTWTVLFFCQTNTRQVWHHHPGVCVCFRFILQSKEEINNQLMDKQKTADEKIKELEVQIHNEIHCSVCAGVCGLTVCCHFQQKKVYLERSVKEAEDNIREMLLSRRAQWSLINTSWSVINNV